MAGPISNLTMTLQQTFSWVAKNANYLFGTQSSQNSFSPQEILGTGAGVITAANQLIVYQPTVINGTPDTIDLSAAVANVLGNAAATLARIFGAMLWLPAVAQNANLGCSSSGITVGDAASNPLLLFGLGSTSTITLANGEMISWMTPSATGLVVGTPKNFKIVNNDSVNNALPILAVVGNDSPDLALESSRRDRPCPRPPSCPTPPGPRFSCTTPSATAPPGACTRSRSRK